MKLGYDYNVYSIPSVLVNQMKVFGSITATTVLRAICAGFMEGNEPHVCACASTAITTVAALEMCVDEVAHGGGGGGGGHSRHHSEDNGGGVPWWVVLLIVLGMLALGGLAAFLYWRRTQQQMRDQVRGILAEYMPLDDLGSSEMTSSKGVQPRPFTEMMGIGKDLDGV